MADFLCLPNDVLAFILANVDPKEQPRCIAHLRQLSKGMKNKAGKLEVCVNVPHIPPSSQIHLDDHLARAQTFRNALRCFPRMRSLRVLTTGRGLSDEDFIGVEHLGNLRSLKLCSLSKIRDKTVMAFAALPSLRRVTLNSLMGITKASFYALANSITIQSITLVHQAQVDEEILMRFAKMPSLQSLYLTNCGSAGKNKADGSKSDGVQALEQAGVAVQTGTFASFALREVARRKREAASNGKNGEIVINL